MFLSFSGSLARVVSVTDHTQCKSLNNKPYLARPTFIDLDSNKIHYYPFIVSLDRCNGSCNALDDLPSRTMCSE